MDAWIFTHPDTWTPTEAPDWGAGENDHAFMARLGYRYDSHASHSTLVEFVGSWSLYKADRADTAYEHALLVDGARELSVLVLLPRFPDLLAYMARYGEIGQHAWDQASLDELEDLLRKAFRAWHGHDGMGICRECDPIAYERWLKERAAWRAQQPSGE